MCELKHLTQKNPVQMIEILQSGKELKKRIFYLNISSINSGYHKWHGFEILEADF